LLPEVISATPKERRDDYMSSKFTKKRISDLEEGGQIQQ
jgi:hypothetical protein